MKTLSMRRMYEGRVLNVRVDEIPTKDGGKRPVEVVEHVGGVGIIVQPAPNEIVLVRQYRHPVADRLWEVPAGMIDPGEDPAAAAARELHEETGYRAERLRFLFSLYPTPGFCNERVRLYAAEGLTPGEAQPEAHEEFEMRTFRLDDAWALVERDELRDGKTQVALAWARTNRRTR